MVDPLPPAPQITATMGNSLKSEKDFMHSIGNCHEFALLDQTLSELRVKFSTDLLENINVKDKSEMRRAMLDEYAKTIKEVEKLHKDYLDKFMTIYPNGDKLEEEVALDQEKIKKLEDEYKEAKTNFDYIGSSKDPSSKAQYTEKYKTTLGVYNVDEARCNGELKKSHLSRMEITIVFFWLFLKLKSCYSSIGLMKKCIIMQKH